MDFHRPIAWRALLATATVGLAAAGFGGACAAQDGRDGASGPYESRYLTWTGKVEHTPRPYAGSGPQATSPNEDTSPPVAPRVPSRYAFDDDWAPSTYNLERRPSAVAATAPPAQAYSAPATRMSAPEAPTSAEMRVPPPPAEEAAEMRPAPRPVEEAAELRPAPPPAEQAAEMRPAPPPAPQASASEPNELFPSYASDGDADASPASADHSATAARAAPARARAYGLSASQSAPSAEATAEPPPAVAQQAVNVSPAAHTGGDTGVRFYSVHRQYGMAPDRIPEPTEGHTVLIGPPDHASAADDGAHDDSQGDADADQADEGDQDSTDAAADGKGAAQAKPHHHASQSGDH
jgi:hypothetical protein